MNSFRTYTAPILLMLVAGLFSIQLHAQSDSGYKAECTVKSSCIFNGSSKISLKKCYSGRDTMETEMQMMWSNSGVYFGLIAESGNFGVIQGVVDVEDSIGVILIELGGKKRGECKEINSEIYENQQEKIKKAQPDFSKFKRIDEPKTVLGYQCDCYCYSDNTQDMKIWVTSEIENVFKNFPSDFGVLREIQIPEGIEGMYMALILNEKSTNAFTEFEFTEINLNKPTAISTEGYSFE